MHLRPFLTSVRVEAVERRHAPRSVHHPSSKGQRKTSSGLRKQMTEEKHLPRFLAQLQGRCLQVPLLEEYSNSLSHRIWGIET